MDKTRLSICGPRTVRVVLKLVAATICITAAFDLWTAFAAAQVDFVPGKHSKGPALPDFEVPPGLNTPERWRLDRPFQTGQRCGPNALYLLLRLERVNASYDKVVDRLKPGSAGCSLEDLHQAAGEFGLRTQVRKLSVEDVRYAPKPIIVHLNAPASASGGADAPRDHFALITTIMPDGGYQGMDTTNMILTTWSPNAFSRNFSGYCLVLSEHWPSVFTWRAVAYSAALALLIGANWHLAGKLRKT